jgi:hypothetical protein
MPKPPSPPANWLDLSKTVMEEDPEEEAADEDAPEAKPIPTDDWSLIRTSSGQAGWVLTRRLVMAIPDEVAQYAEGRQIVSYFRLADTLDGGERKPTWLWTTVGSGDQPYDFDNFRVFVWSVRRHRYETSYIERNIKGWSPVTVRPAGDAGDPTFSICLENRDGQRVRREYVMMGNVVRSGGERPCEVAPLLEPSTGNIAVAALPKLPPEAPQQHSPGLFDRMWDGLHSTVGRLFGHR